MGGWGKALEVVTLAVAGAAIFFLGRTTSRSRDPLEQEVAQLHNLVRHVAADVARIDSHAACPPTAGALTQEATLPRDDLKQAVNEVLDQREKVTQAETVRHTPPVDAEAHGKGERIIDVAMARKEWTEQDRADLRQLFPLMGDDERRNIVQRLSVSFNQREMSSNFPGPPF
jgi:NAD(P)-dependent dehydrogenase (short-subunit alcohol dehydrogenase family)